jgi:hypothetical protein
MDLTEQEARFLRSQLGRHLEEVDDELVHTDTRELQHALHRDLDHLKALLAKLDDAIRQGTPRA